MKRQMVPRAEMIRRQFLKGASGAVAAMNLHGCASAPTKSTKASFPGLRDLMVAQVAEGKLPGAVWLVAQRGDVAVETVGTSAIGSTTPMQRNTIFRIASMT